MMVRIFFFFWMLSGKVKPQYDNYGYRDFDKGRPLYHLEKDSFLYKGEVLNYIKTGVVKYDVRYSDRSGKIASVRTPFDTIAYSINKSDTVLLNFPIYKKRKRVYCIDPYTEQKIYLEAKRN